MIYGVSSSSDYDELDKYDVSHSDQNALSGKKLYTAVFVNDCSSQKLTKTINVQAEKLKVDQEIEKAFHNKKTEIKPMSCGGSVTVDATISWGGSEGTKGSIGISAEAHDDRGNQVEISVDQDSDGQGSATISGSAGDTEDR